MRRAADHELLFLAGAFRSGCQCGDSSFHVGCVCSILIENNRFCGECLVHCCKLLLKGMVLFSFVFFLAINFFFLAVFTCTCYIQ